MNNSNAARLTDPKSADPQSADFDIALRALDNFRIEIPSWGFANTGTRFGKFVQAAAAVTIEEKFSDAAEVNRLTGATPTLALHVLWDLPHGIADVPEVKSLENRFGIRAGSINPTSFRIRNTNLAPSAIPPPRSAGKLSTTSSTPSKSQKSLPPAMSPSGCPTAPTIPARKASASASAGLKKPSALLTTT